MKATHLSAGGCRASGHAEAVAVSVSCLAVIMPCYNEVGTVDAIIARVVAEPVVAAGAGAAAGACAPGGRWSS